MNAERDIAGGIEQRTPAERPGVDWSVIVHYGIPFALMMAIAALLLPISIDAYRVADVWTGFCTTVGLK